VSGHDVEAGESSGETPPAGEDAAADPAETPAS
jgi:hypothetical protein